MPATETTQKDPVIVVLQLTGGLADRRGGRDGNRGRVRHHVAQGGRS